jgi:hypothetical protein
MEKGGAKRGGARGRRGGGVSDGGSGFPLGQFLPSDIRRYETWTNEL